MMAFGFGGFSMVFMFIFWIIIAGLIIWGLMQFVSGATGKAANTGAPPSGRNQVSALDLLKQRYARGEISKAEYEEMRRELSL